VNLDFELEILYQSTHQSTPGGADLRPIGGLATGGVGFPDSAQGVAGRFEVTRNF